ncbi:ECF RNA polymerase sigma factor SigK [Planctomycetes bacterium Poly30]|uniref:ECF RNA polymerase sigma factor SigK n=1 Tax=Saltatorellus ferox TaxID=2528018 RepID=A0A518EW05_9BACT|nr:ECF RNA polymerase sigma factor SigK [Planctomycetes bacterium Poly30]
MKHEGEEDWLAHARWVRGLARDVLRDAQRAEDVSQEALLAAWQSDLDGGQDPAGLRRWLAATARNLARMTVRSESNRRAREVEAGSARGNASGAAGASGGAAGVDERIELQRRVAEAVAALAPEDREVVVLRYFDGLAPREIARRLNTTPNAVSSRLSRARGKLRQDLGDRDLRSWAMAAAGLGSLTAEGFRAESFRATASHAGCSAPSGASSASSLATTWLVPIAMKKFAVLVAALLSLVLLGSLWRGAEPSGSEERLAAAPELPEPAMEVTLVDLLEVQAPEGSSARADAAADVTDVAQLAPPEPAAPEMHGLSATTGAVLVRVLHEGTEEPMPHVGVSLARFSTSRWHDSVEVSTNARGERLFTSLPVGSVHARAWRNGSYVRSRPEASVEVEPGETAEIVLRVGGGMTLRGRVIDEQGRAVPGAEIWMSQGNGAPDTSLLAGYADAQGRFAIPHAKKLQCIGARAPGMQPSLQEMPGVYEPTDPEVGVTLVLQALGGELHGRVVTPSGAPVAQAVVKIVFAGVKSSGRPIPRDGGYAYPAAALLLKTDQRGGFSTDRLGSGAFRVVARGPRTDTGAQTVEIAPGGSAEVEVVVGDAGSLTGTLTDHLGQPVPGAHLSVTGAEWDLSFAEATTDEAGSYVFPMLCTGEVKVTVDTGRDGGGLEGTVLISAGQASEWSPSLPAPLALLGRAFSANGVPLNGFHVRGAAPGEEGPMAFFQVDVREDGTFEAPSCLDATYDLSLHLPGRWMGDALLQLNDMQAGSVAAEFVLEDAHLPTASLTGRVLDSGGNAIPVVLTIEGEHPLVLITRRLDNPMGEFHIPFLPPGEYVLSLDSEGHAPQTLELSPPLAGSEAREIPTFRLEAE